MPQQLAGIDRICQYCGKHFSVPPKRLRRGAVRFCSNACRFKSFQVARIERICQQCGNHFTITPWQFKVGKGKFCSFRCRCDSQIGRPLSEETRKRLSLVRAIRAKDPAYIAKLSKAQTRVLLKRWRDPEYVRKLMRALHTKPTKPEQRLMDIFSKNLPQFEYNGDFRLEVMVGGLIPDFVNINGKKEIIEFFSYHHSPEVIGDDWRRSELGKVMIYNSLGWKCLVIWQSELDQLSDSEVVGKINLWRKRCHNLHRVK